MLRRRGNESQKLDSPGEAKRESEVVRDDKMVVVWGRQDDSHRIGFSALGVLYRHPFDLMDLISI
jgi:hypothetical protein